MMTSAAARFSFDERDRGSIEVGKLGDFIILDDHLLTVPADRLRTIRADMTVIGGKVVFEKERLPMNRRVFLTDAMSAISAILAAVKAQRGSQARASAGSRWLEKNPEPRARRMREALQCIGRRTDLLPSRRAL